jgi:photosystem II stability/assembly factor-like uncharacterized protein
VAQAQLLYVGTQEGVAILSNPGRTDRWLTVGLELPAEQVIAVACQSDSPMDATVWTAAGAVHHTSDGGQTWEALTAPGALPAPRVELVFAGGPPASIRVSADALGLERTADAGASWQRLELDSLGSWTVISAPAYHPDIAYAGTSQGDVWLSTDRGRTWNRIKRDLPPVTALAIGRVIS